MPTIRDATPGDIAGIGSLLRTAFPSDAEARLLDALRAEGALLAERVASAPPDLQGVVALSRLGRSDNGPVLAALAPLAACPERQGIGSALVRDVIETARRLGQGGVVVLGDPALYGRFGFRPAPQLLCRWSGPFLLALALEEGAVNGEIELDYPPPFDALG